MSYRLRLALPFALLLLASLACSVDLGTAATAAPSPSPVAVLKDIGFEAPADGSQLPFGPVEVKTYAWVDVGITRAELNVNGVTLRTDPVTNEKVNGAFALTHITQVWQPPTPGTYTLSVRVQDALGNLYTINTITVHIVDANGTATTIPVDGPPTETPTLAATATLEVSATRPRITFTPSQTASATLAGAATSTLTPSATVAAGAPFTTFAADSTSINAGQCTTLHWTSGGIQSIFLNNQPVTGAENKQVCPPTTATFTLLAHSTSGDITKQITITVTAGSAPFTTFTADSTSLTAGQCTMLHWTSGNIQSIFLDNQPVTGAENKQVCPTAPTTYTLLAHSTAGDITKQVTIQVSGGTPFVNFTADSTTITNGQCTMLHWTSGNIQSIFLNNQAATGTENRQVCPTSTTTYTLLAHTVGGDITKQITITVNGAGGNPPSGSKPVLSSPVLSSPEFYNRSACGPTTLTISVTVTNATSVTLNFSIPGGVSGIAPMNTSNNSEWSYTLHVDDTLEIPTQPTGMLNFNFKAEGPGGTTSSITYNVIPLKDCP
jgi:hypothetical protein